MQYSIWQQTNKPLMNTYQELSCQENEPYQIQSTCISWTIAFEYCYVVLYSLYFFRNLIRTTDTALDLIVELSIGIACSLISTRNHRVMRESIAVLRQMQEMRELATSTTYLARSYLSIGLHSHRFLQFHTAFCCVTWHCMAIVYSVWQQFTVYTFCIKQSLADLSLAPDSQLT